MYDPESALLGDDLEGLPDVTEVDHPTGAVWPDVGGEDLDGRVARLDRLGELAELSVGRLARQHQVISPIAGALGREILVACRDGRLHALVRTHVGEVDQRGRAAPERRHADAVGPLGVEDGAVGDHKRVLHVNVRIDAAGHDDLVPSVDHPRCVSVGERPRRRNGDDCFAHDGHVALGDALGCHHVAAANNQIQHVYAVLPRSTWSVHQGNRVAKGSADTGWRIRPSTFMIPLASMLSKYAWRRSGPPRSSRPAQPWNLLSKSC